MKKILLSMLAITMAAFTFTSCEDVPEPYEIPGGGNNGGGTAEGVYIDKDFSSTLDGFTQTGTNSNISWIIDYSSACITGYKDYDGSGTKSNQAGVTYLVSNDAVDLTNAESAYVEINHALNYEKGDINANNSVLISKDYAGNADAATWELLPYNTDGLNSGFTFATKTMNIPESFIGEKVYIALRHTCTESFSSTWEVKKLSVKEGTADEPETPDTGDNSKDNPYTVAYAIANNSGKAWVKGYIVGWVEGQVLTEGANFNGNASSQTNLLIADNADETDVKKCIPVQLPIGNVRTALNLKDNPGNYKKEVILLGSLEKYFGTAGLKTVTDFVLDGKEGGGTEEPIPGEPKGDGTVENPFNAAGVIDYISKLPDGTESDINVYVKGKVSSIKENYGTQFGNATFYISDDGETTSTQFCVYRALYEGNVKYTGGDQLTVGDEVVICGKVVNYMGNTPETVTGKAYLYSWTKKNGGTGEGGGEGGDEPGAGEITENSITVTAISFGVVNGKEMGTQTLADGTILIFDGGGNTNVPKYYDNGQNIRMYPNNNVTVKASKKIESIILNCDEANGQIYNASGDVAAAPGTVNTNEKVITVSGINAAETVITNTSTTTGAPSQMRIVSLTINYEK